MFFFKLEVKSVHFVRFFFFIKVVLYIYDTSIYNTHTNKLKLCAYYGSWGTKSIFLFYIVLFYNKKVILIKYLCTPGTTHHTIIHHPRTTPSLQSTKSECIVRVQLIQILFYKSAEQVRGSYFISDVRIVRGRIS